MAKYDASLTDEPQLIKRPYQKLRFDSPEQQTEFLRCAVDPVYFIDTYIYVQHPTKGKVPFRLYDYQKNLVKTYQNYRNVVAMCSRQLGKSVTAGTNINCNGKTMAIEGLVPLSFREKIVNFLEKQLIRLAKS
jgi:hypothetical protein